MVRLRSSRCVPKTATRHFPNPTLAGHYKYGASAAAPLASVAGPMLIYEPPRRKSSVSLIPYGPFHPVKKPCFCSSWDYDMPLL